MPMVKYGKRYMNKKRSIWLNLLLALLTIPVAVLLIYTPIYLIAGLADIMFKNMSDGYWWVNLIPLYLLVLAYYIYEPTFSQNRKRKKVVNSLILYWKDQLWKQGSPYPSERDTELMHELFLERVKIWGWNNQEIWDEHFPDEKYSKFLFGIVDNFMAKEK